MKNVLPRPLYDAIAQHIRDGVSHAEDGWEAGSDEEDTLTGDLGSALRHKETSVQIGMQKWVWKVTYKKFRSKGAKAEETALGADGLFQVEVEDEDTGYSQSKGLLFQAKKEYDRRTAKLQEQAQNMENLISNAGAIFRYSSNGYFAATTSEYLNSGDRAFNTPVTLGEFFFELPSWSNGPLLRCKPPKDHRAPSRFKTVETRIAAFNVDHRIKIEVKVKMITPAQSIE